MFEAMGHEIRSLARELFRRGIIDQDDCYILGVSQALIAAGHGEVNAPFRHWQEAKWGDPNVREFYRNSVIKLGEDTAAKGEIPPLEEIENAAKSGPVFFDRVHEGQVCVQGNDVL